MRDICFVCLLFLNLAYDAKADSANTDIFVYPTAPGPSNNFVGNEVWANGSMQTIQWVTNQTDYYIALYQQHTDPPSGIEVQSIYCMLFHYGSARRR